MNCLEGKLRERPLDTHEAVPQVDIEPRITFSIIVLFQDYGKEENWNQNIKGLCKDFPLLML